MDQNNGYDPYNQNQYQGTSNQQNYGYQQPGYQQPGYPQQGYQQPYGQNNYGGYNQDPGANDASNCKIFGILSLFLLPTIFAILALVKYNAYQRIGNGSHQSDAKTGRTCAIISFVIQGLAILISIIAVVAGGLLAARSYGYYY